MRKGCRQKARTTRVAEMADFAGVSEPAFRKWMKLPGFPMSADGAVCLWDLAIWRHRYEGGFGDMSEAIDVGAGDSPSLERLRSIRADQEAIKLDAMRGNFLPRDDVHSLLGELASVIRQSLERLQRDFGPEAMAIVGQAIGDLQQRFEEHWESDRVAAETATSDSLAC